MVKYVCDRCGKELDKLYRKCIAYSDDNSADLCKECIEELLNWMKNKPAEDKRNENYERVEWDGKSHIALL